MTKTRTYTTYSKPQGFDRQGRPRCLQCRKGITAPRRRTFCGTPCAEAFRLRTSPSYVRAQVWKRDHGVCARCHADTCAGRLPKFRRARGTGHLWQAHHVVAVCEGGGQCGLDNYETRCTACHREETNTLMKRRQQAVK